MPTPRRPRPADPSAAARTRPRRVPPAASAAASGASPPDLRRRILEAAAELLRTEGVGGLSMREVARRAGVTHQAPYHHFADREAIVAELVTGGFTMLADRLARANDGAARLGARRALLDCGRAYVGFAMEQPGRFRIMFRPELCDPTRFPAAAQASERAYGELTRMVALAHGAPDATLATLHWSMVHGLASLMVDGGLADRMPGARARQAHIEAVLATFVDIATAPPGGARARRRAPASRPS
jgi:AcrR family transcriptional regulator